MYSYLYLYNNEMWKNVANEEIVLKYTHAMVACESYDAIYGEVKY